MLLSALPGRPEESESAAARFRVQLQIPERAGRGVRGPRESAVQFLDQAAAAAAAEVSRTVMNLNRCTRVVIASQRVRPELAGPMTSSAKQSSAAAPSGLLRRFAARNDGNHHRGMGKGVPGPLTSIYGRRKAAFSARA